MAWFNGIDRRAGWTSLGVGRSHLAWALLIAAAIAVAGIATRPVLPVDELRYLAVAWEMHLSGNWLVPTLDGQPYSHKPPLLFWLINLGWLVLGPVEWWARAVAPLAGMACLVLTAAIGRRLWPTSDEVAPRPTTALSADQSAEEPNHGRRSFCARWVVRPAEHLLRFSLASWRLGGSSAGNTAALVLAGGWFWAVFTSLTYFDGMLTAGVLLAVLGLLPGSRFAWLPMGLAIAVLAKGPVALVHLAAAGVAIAWLLPGGRDIIRPRRMVAGVVLGLVPPLLWALAASWAAGPEFARDLWWEQQAGRAMDSFAHAAPAWYYLPVVGLILVPWLFWPGAWQLVRRAVGQSDPALRMLLAWSGLVVLGLSLVSAKQPHYLLPVVPVLALILGRALTDRPITGQVGQAGWLKQAGWPKQTGSPQQASPPQPATLPAGAPRWRDSLVLPAGVLAMIGLAALIVPRLGLKHLPEWLGQLPLWPGPTLIALAVVLALWGRGPLALALATGVAVGIGHAGASTALHRGFDLTPVAQVAARYQASGAPVALIGVSHGELTWPGRLTMPVVEIQEETALRWCHEHRDGAIVIRSDRPPAWTGRPLVEIPAWRGRQHLGLYPAAQLAAAAGWHPPMCWPPFPPAPNLMH
ncbi:hypothetical protein LBMAG53_30770 [Planctomycetota bacterium]|nr:hypothetical protein LBMAG53_30770 [Planctomycetota bacterium]